jgi:hypoxanthine-guanine phosphoribosyltransferase
MKTLSEFEELLPIGGDENRVYNNYFVLLDDSYYSGTTKKEIEKHLKQYNAKILKTYVFYDGSFTKKPDVYSIYRYYDYHSDDVIPIKRLIGILNSIDEPNIPYDNIENQIMRGQVRSVKELLREIQILKQKFNHGSGNINISSYGYKREYEKKNVKDYKGFINEKNSEGYYTFEDLEFKPRFLEEQIPGWEFREEQNYLKVYLENMKKSKKAKMTFDNGYGISVLLGEFFHSNGVDNYEIGHLNPNGELIDGVVYDYQTKEEVTEHMLMLQKKKPPVRIFSKEDPYGEEDWEVNENFNSNVVSKEGWIYFKSGTVEEFKILMEFLGKIGFRWLMGEFPTSYIPQLDANPCQKINIITKIIMGTVRENQEEISKKALDIDELIEFLKSAYLDDFIENFNKKREEIKLKMMDVDPYGEENWEDVELNESVDCKYEIGDWFKCTHEIGHVNVDDIVNLVGIYTQKNPGKFIRLDWDVYEIRIPRGICLLISKNVLEEAFKKIKVSTTKSDIDPYGEESWEVNESIEDEFSLSVDDFFKMYENKGRKHMIGFLKDKDLEFHAKSKTEIYKGPICGLIPALFTKENDKKILFDTKQHGTLEVNKEHPIIIREQFLDE